MDKTVFKRKIYDEILEWKEKRSDKYALLIKGARRVGKSTIVEEFAKKEFKSYILIDFAHTSKAIIELLLSTGCRVGELVEMTCNNINWMEKSILVTGKGNKQRYVYFDDVTAMYLDDYLKSRNDNSISLFVTSKGDKKKLEISSVEDMIRDIIET